MLPVAMRRYILLLLGCIMFLYCPYHRTIYKAYGDQGKVNSSSTGHSFITLKEFFSVVGDSSDNIFQIWPFKPAFLYLSLCSMESWALNHPNASVWHISTVKKLQDPDEVLHKLMGKYSNIKFIYTDLNKAFAETPLYNFYKLGLMKSLNSSATPGTHICDLLRQALVWHKGGYYADTDVFPVKGLTDQRNFIMSDKRRLDSSLIHFDAHHPFLKASMERSSTKYNPKNYGTIAIETFTKVARKICDGNKGKKPLSNGNGPTRECKIEGYPLHLLDFKYIPQCCHSCLTPGSGKQFQKYLDAGVYAFHICETENAPLSFKSGNILQVVAEKNCPFIFKRAQLRSKFW